MFTLPTAAAGFVSSIIAEIFKFFPALRGNSVVTSLVAIVVVSVVSFVENGMTWSLENVLGTLASAFVSYKIFVQPIATETGSRTQLSD